MKRDDLRAAIKIERAYKGNKNTFTDIAHRPVTDDELVEAITADPDLRAKVLESLLVLDPRVRTIARAIGYPSEWYEFHGSHHRCSQEYQRYAERRAVDRYNAIEAAVRVVAALDSKRCFPDDMEAPE